jgi:hypothetical protein
VISIKGIARAAFHDVGFTECTGFMAMHNNCLQRRSAARAALNVGIIWMRVVIHQFSCIIPAGIAWELLTLFCPRQYKCQNREASKPKY